MNDMNDMNALYSEVFEGPVRDLLIITYRSATTLNSPHHPQIVPAQSIDLSEMHVADLQN